MVNKFELLLFILLKIKMYKYRIQWISKLTGVENYGSWFNITKKQMLEEDIIRLNKEYKNLIHHWLVTSM